MSLITHLAVFSLLVLDLIFGASLAERFGGRFAMLGFEFLLILGYVLFVLQWGVPWSRREGGDR